jgi:cellulose synthase/poly-beta-1,6-N-acetylglucosamine synthase-like glycosyltransferase
MIGARQRVITVGIPAHNEETTIRTTVEKLLSQRLPSGTRMELIVCANACKDRTASIVRELGRANPRVKLIETPERGKPNAINLIKRHANGRELFFCDADTLVEPDGVAKMLSVLDNKPELMAVTVKSAPYITSRPNQVERISHISMKTYPGRFICGQFFGIRRDALPQIPRHIINEDAWLSATLGMERFQILPEVQTQTMVPHTIGGFLQQRTRTWAGWHQLHQIGLIPRTGIFNGGVQRALSKELTFGERLQFALFGVPARAYSVKQGRVNFEKDTYKRGWKPPTRKPFQKE